MISLSVNSTEIAQALRGIEQRAGHIRSAVQNVITRYVHIIAREAKGFAPVGETGNLRKSIRPVVARFAGSVLAGNEEVPYAAAVELGRTDLPNYPIQSFLRPAFEMHRAAFLRDLKAALANPDSAPTAGVSE